MERTDILISPRTNSPMPSGSVLGFGDASPSRRLFVEALPTVDLSHDDLA